MYIEECAETHRPVFKVGIPEQGKWFWGYTPTDPWTKWCCDLSSTGNGRASGPYFYGFSDYKLQRILRRLILATDEDEYRYRLGGLGISTETDQEPGLRKSKAYMSSAKLKANYSAQEFNLNSGEWTLGERELLVVEIEKIFDPKQDYFPWGMVSLNLVGRTGFMCQSEYNALSEQQATVGKTTLPIRGLAVKEPHVPTLTLMRGLTNMGMKKQADKGMGKSKRTRRTFLSGGGNFKVKPSRLQLAGEEVPLIKRGKTPLYSSDSSDEEAFVEGEAEPGPENPCPEAKDCITFQKMRQPSICPCGNYIAEHRGLTQPGYVCDYTNWIRILAGGNTLEESVLLGESSGPATVKDTCPFTKKHHTRRMIVKLTFDNWERYKDIIRDV
jgi:hypothetical protein